MFELLRECIEEDCPDAWQDFWSLFLQVSAPVVRRKLKACRLCEADIDDVVMETMLGLCENSHRRLRSFGGASQFELAAWLSRVANNQACDWLRRREANQPKMAPFTQELHSELQCPADINVPLFLREIAECIDDIGVRLNEREVQRLRLLAGLEPMPDGISERTIRHWRRSLERRLEHFV
ncbi:MAG: sigma-70 family RNA polymerase sigma factor [Planctomycetaceae bacterium]|nr:sigma-70 family RNA polymerase sigma factor [Planctomycetales bacterium]MCB9873203.1 sigma-70 family RNA polymerase sigma factor [Planctomycetaceae bacterium]MCB9940721.1 sigma-70 family RNA polymerase sigma factor [Planctomycetaceae bacterium]HRX78272.1 sigma-70 family RNA polymerase sigma factor [Pirellulaceae bacterium]